ncbi:hypothetical protein VTO73DRAFT_5341 [Trametes versicolor]
MSALLSSTFWLLLNTPMVPPEPKTRTKSVPMVDLNRTKSKRSRRSPSTSSTPLHLEFDAPPFSSTRILALIPLSYHSVYRPPIIIPLRLKVLYCVCIPSYTPHHRLCPLVFTVPPAPVFLFDLGAASGERRLDGRIAVG